MSDGTGVSGDRRRYDSDHAWRVFLSSARLAASTVLLMSMATVIGPTPPGTGVTKEALDVASSYATSP